MPICPEDNVQMVEFTGDVQSSTAKFWECPKHGGRYVGYGFRLDPVPKAIVSVPTAAEIQITNLVANSDGMIHRKEYNVTPMLQETNIVLIALAIGQTI